MNVKVCFPFFNYSFLLLFLINHAVTLKVYFFCTLGEETNNLSLEDIVVFFSGSNRVPPLGFDYSPTLSFDEDSVFPISSTCALSLVLPSGYNEYEVFKEKAHYGCKNHGGFGKL